MLSKDLWLRVIATTTAHELIPDFRQRRAQGLEIYGVPVHIGNERNMVADAFAELADYRVYVEGCKALSIGEAHKFWCERALVVEREMLAIRRLYPDDDLLGKQPAPKPVNP